MSNITVKKDLLLVGLGTCVSVSALRVVCIPYLAAVYRSLNLVCKNFCWTSYFLLLHVQVWILISGKLWMWRETIHWCLFLVLRAQASLQRGCWRFLERSVSRSEEHCFSWISFQQVAFYWPLAQLPKDTLSQFSKGQNLLQNTLHVLPGITAFKPGLVHWRLYSA